MNACPVARMHVRIWGCYDMRSVCPAQYAKSLYKIRGLDSLARKFCDSSATTNCVTHVMLMHELASAFLRMSGCRMLQNLRAIESHS